MKTGTKSLLFGYHQFLLHPLMVAAAWWKLHGFPYDPRLWLAFFVHDLGYIGKPDMDGVEGQQHPFLGAHIMHFLFDGADEAYWYQFCLYHSRTLAKIYFAPMSKLCYADKLAFLLYPEWLLRLLYWLSGEGVQYMNDSGHTDWDSWYEWAANNNHRTLNDRK
jgi:hypothetical protein